MQRKILRARAAHDDHRQPKPYRQYTHTDACAPPVTIRPGSCCGAKRDAVAYARASPNCIAGFETSRKSGVVHPFTSVNALTPKHAHRNLFGTSFV